MLLSYSFHGVFFFWVGNFSSFSFLLYYYGRLERRIVLLLLLHLFFFFWQFNIETNLSDRLTAVGRYRCVERVGVFSVFTFRNKTKINIHQILQCQQEIGTGMKYFTLGSYQTHPGYGCRFRGLQVSHQRPPTRFINFPLHFLSSLSMYLPSTFML